MASDERRRADETDDRLNEVPIAEVEDDPEAPLYSSVPLETDHGVVVVQQQNVGPGNEEGGGEWPDPHTPPRFPAPGAASGDSGEDEDDADAAHHRRRPGQRA